LGDVFTEMGDPVERVLTTFAKRGEFEKARRILDESGLTYWVIAPHPGYARVGAPCLVVDPEARAALARREGEFVSSGWVEYRPARVAVPDAPPPDFEEDLVGRAAIMLLAPCVADPTKVRLIAHIRGDLTPVLPYLNAEMRAASFNPRGPTFTFMEGYRMISLYPRRITIAKADEIVDAWRVLEWIRCHANRVWARRTEIQPSYETRERPSALEIFKRLPGTNCRACGEPTCLAFAVKVRDGAAPVGCCRPVFDGPYEHLKDALLEACRGIGVAP